METVLLVVSHSLDLFCLQTVLGRFKTLKLLVLERGYNNNMFHDIRYFILETTSTADSF